MTNTFQNQNNSPSRDKTLRGKLSIRGLVVGHTRPAHAYEHRLDICRSEVANTALPEDAFELPCGGYKTGSRLTFIADDVTMAGVFAIITARLGRGFMAASRLALLGQGQGHDEDHETQQHERFLTVSNGRVHPPADEQQQRHRLAEEEVEDVD